MPTADRSISDIGLIVDDIPENLSLLHDALDELIGLGYLRGILNKLGEIERLDTAHAEFVRVLRDLARQFQFDAMKEILRKVRDASPDTLE